MLSEQEHNDEEDELYEHYRLVVDKGQMLMRLDRYLKHYIPKITRTKLQNAIDTESVKVNERVSKSSYQVKPFDVITVSMPHPPSDYTLLPEDLHLDIQYEDDDLLIVNKPAGMVVHPAFGHWAGTLVNGLVYHLQNLPTHKNGEIRPGLVHRIDKDTSGLLVIAKNDYAMAFLAKQFAEHSIERTYIALCWGEPKQADGTITGHIGRSTRDRKIMDVFEDGSQGKHAVTHYKTLKPMRYVALVQCNLETGRTHQIRAHFQHIGHPLFGDATYGGDKILRGTTSGSYRSFAENCLEMMPRQSLHAKSLGFIHPKTNQWVQFDSELPDDFRNVIDKWDSYMAQLR
jgi:23S rRNA pseudouridine1911/1915/1917 synthase